MASGPFDAPTERNDIPEIEPVQLQQRLERGGEVTILDVREPFEWDIANLERRGARLIPLMQLGSRLDELEKEADIVVHCHSGARSALAVQQLREAGFANVWNLRGGILAWSDEVDPSVPKY